MCIHKESKMTTMTTIMKRQISCVLLLIPLTIILANEIENMESKTTISSGAASAPNDDDRTYLDVFGQAAKEYLTTQLIPETDADCRWSWRHGRCEPFCDCHFNAQWGDFHLGRSCRKRLQGYDYKAPLQCDMPPETTYAVLVQKTLDRTSLLTTKTRISLANWKRRVQEETCGSLPTECSDDSDENRRSIKQKVLCRHVPPPCQDEDEELAQFVSPLDKLNNESTRLRKDDISTDHENLNTRVEQPDREKETYSVEDGIWRLSYNEESEDVNEPNEAK